MEEEKLPCGHVDSFEHRLVVGLQSIFEIAARLQVDPTYPAMQYVQQVFETFVLRIPTIDEVRQITLINSSKEVN